MLLTRAITYKCVSINAGKEHKGSAQDINASEASTCMRDMDE